MSIPPENIDAAPRTVVLADQPMGQTLADQMASPSTVRADDEYSLLEQLAENGAATVVLTAPRDEFAALARAVRRLGPGANIMAFATPSELADVSQAVDGIVDDCCTFPPTRAEMGMLARGGSGQEGRTVGLTPNELSGLIASTRNIESLEDFVAALLGEKLAVPMEWVNADECPADAQPLLSLPQPESRMLIAAGRFSMDGDADALICDLHQQIPALLAVARQSEMLHRLAITDHLTGAYNRRYFYHLAAHVLKRAQQQGFRVSLMLYDIDNFKHYNDQYGHAAGDEILRDTAEMMKRICREQDIVARIGGDEFAVMFWDSELREENSQPLHDALELADRFRSAVEQHDFESLGSHATGTLTISGGLASFPEHGQTSMELMKQADQALRAAKQQGKNSIQIVGNTQEA